MLVTQLFASRPLLAAGVHLELQEQLKKGVNGKHDDVVDALSMLVERASPPRKEPVEAPEQQWPEPEGNEAIAIIQRISERGHHDDDRSREWLTH